MDSVRWSAGTHVNSDAFVVGVGPTSPHHIFVFTFRFVCFFCCFFLLKKNTPSNQIILPKKSEKSQQLHEAHKRLHYYY